VTARPHFAIGARRAASAVVLALLAACASGGAEPETAPTTQPGQPAGGTQAQPGAWGIRTREHVDLWMHGFGMLIDDTARVPWFRRGYRDEMVVLKNRANVTTLLDANRDRLRARFAANRNLPIQGQFVALYFGSWDEVKQAASLFLQAEGDPQRAGNQATASAIALFAQSFPTAADRDWVRLFLQSLDDEAQKYYHSYWLAAQRERAPALARLDSLWQRVHRQRLQAFLNNTQQPNGSFLLSLPLNGEGRTIKAGDNQNIVTVSYPATPAEAEQSIYVFAHEIAGQMAASAVADNITPNERRTGAADQLQSAAAVRAGYQLLARVDASLAPGYAEYYLRAVNASRGSGSLESRLAAVFPLPETIAQAIVRQLDIVLGGI
jgi:hypothetical protein